MRATLCMAMIALIVGCTTNDEAAGPGRLLVTGPEGEVWLVDPITGEEEELAAPADHPGPVQPTASPDGKSIAWTAATATGDPIIRLHDETGERDIAAPTFPFFYGFAPEGTVVAALGNHPEGDGVALMLVDVAAGEAEIVDVGRPYYLDWHPGDETLAVHVGIGELAVLDENAERQALSVQTGDFQAPAWTQDGRLVAVRRADGAATSLTAQVGLEELVVVDVADGSHQDIVGVEGPVAFDVAGARVAFVSGGVGPLDVVSLDGEGEREVTSDTVAAFEWSPSGELLLFHVLDPEEGLVPHVWDGVGTTAYPGFVPSQVYVTQFLPFWPQYARSVTQWAPDESGFAYAEHGQEPTVWLQPLDDERREMGPGTMVTWIP